AGQSGRCARRFCDHDPNLDYHVFVFASDLVGFDRRDAGRILLRRYHRFMVGRWYADVSGFPNLFQDTIARVPSARDRDGGGTAMSVGLERALYRAPM